MKIDANIECHIRLSFVGARSARLQHAELALEDKPVRSGIAHRAVPQQQTGIRLDDLELVCAVSWVRHGLESGTAYRL